MKLILVRHGETIENASEVVMGHIDGRLSNLGKTQAQKVGERLKHEKINQIYSSDLGRCKETVAEIAKHHPKIKILFNKDLRERDAGIHTGITNKKFLDEIKGKHIFKYRITKGESLLDVRRRARKFIDELFKKFPDDTIVICTHGGWIRMLLGSLLNLTPKRETHPYFKIYNSAVTIVELKQKQNLIHYINCTHHLNNKESKSQSGE